MNYKVTVSIGSETSKSGNSKKRMLLILIEVGLLIIISTRRWLCDINRGAPFGRHIPWNPRP